MNILKKKRCPFCDQKEILDHELRLTTDDGTSTYKLCKSCADVFATIEKNVNLCVACNKNRASHDTESGGLCSDCLVGTTD